MTPHSCRTLCEYQANLLQSNSYKNYKIIKNLMSCEIDLRPMDQSAFLSVVESLTNSGEGNLKHQKYVGDYYLIAGSYPGRMAV